MLRLALTALLLLATPALITSSWAAEKRVWRVDSVIATQGPDSVVVEVKGAVQSGGWSHARLKTGHGDGQTLVVEFLAQPPAAGTTVITALMPVTATVTIRGRGPVSVKVQAEANEVTAQILH